MKLLVVGGGATGSFIAHLLNKSGSVAKVALSLWEKSRGVGGRMSTHRFDGDLMADMGAQYITVPCKLGRPTTAMTTFNETIQELLYANILVPFCGVIEGELNSRQEAGKENFVAPRGINSIAKHFINNSKTQVCFNKRLVAVDVSANTLCCTAEDGTSETFDGLVLTIPLPQVSSLQGNISTFLKQHEGQLSKAEYSSRYAVAFTFKQDALSCFTWSSKYFQDDVIRYVSCEPRKRGETNLPMTVLLVHTSVPFGLHHLEDDKQAISKTIESRLSLLIPGLPPSVDSYCVRWRYSQVRQQVCGSEGYLVIQDTPLVVLTGDAFTHSNLEGTFKAASATAGLIEQRLSCDVTA